MKKEVCLMCIVCFFLGYFVADVVSKCGFGREHFLKTTYAAQDLYLPEEHLRDPGEEIDPDANWAEHLSDPGGKIDPNDPASMPARCATGDPNCKADPTNRPVTPTNDSGYCRGPLPGIGCRK